jgi:hypothetical protein
MIVVRLLGLLLAAAAMTIGGIDLGRGWGQGRFTFTALGKLWYDLHPASLNMAQAGIQRHLTPAIWDPGIVTILTLPAALVLGGLGILLLVVPRSRRR